MAESRLNDDLDLCTQGLKKLEDAVVNSDVDALKQLLKQGVDVNVPFDSGISPLGKAILIGNEEIIHLIMNAKQFYSPDETNKCEESKKSKMMDLSCLKFNEEQSSSDGSGKTSVGLDLFNSLRENKIYRDGCDINLPDFQDRTPLFYAVECENYKIVKELLSAGSKVNVSDQHNISPLHLSVCKGNYNICELLLQAGSRVNGRTCEYKCSVLHTACSRGNLRIVELLVKYGANIECLDNVDSTPLMVAVDRCHHDIVEFLLSKGAKVNVEDMRGQTPLSIAVGRNDYTLVRKLLEGGARFRTQRKHLLCQAVVNKSPRICELLLRNGALVHTSEATFRAPLREAMKTQSLEIFHMLLRFGTSARFDAYIEDETALHDLCNELGHKGKEVFSDYLDLLINFGADLNGPFTHFGDTPLFQSIVQQKFEFSKELILRGCDPNLGHVFSCPTNDNLCMLIQRKQFPLIKLMVYAGYQIHRFNFNYTSILEHPEWEEIRSFLWHFKKNPLSLKYLTRIAIRMQIQNLDRVNLLPLPRRLKNFILFKDMDSLL